MSINESLHNATLDILASVLGEQVRLSWGFKGTVEKIAVINEAMEIINNTTEHGLSEAERKALAVLNRYRDELRMHGKIASYYDMQREAARKIRKAIKRTRRTVI